jgi:release factor glutamine methyltransferase
MTTVAEAAEQLARAGVPSARHDAEACHLLGVRTHELPRSDLGSGYEDLVARRARREPLQYIVGSSGFRRLELLVGPGAFVPRPETELLAGWVIDALQMHDSPVVVDLCAGPGTIALAIAYELPGAVVYAVEAEPAAADWARRNIEATGLPVKLAIADVAGVLPELNGTVDAVVANPPYLVRGSVRQPEVQEHEPDVALYADDNGIAVIQQVLTSAERLLRPGGLVAVEHGDDHGSVVPELVREHGFTDVRDHRDLADRDRFTTGVRA